MAVALRTFARLQPRSLLAAARPWRYSGSQAKDSEGARPSSMADAVSEQRQVLFPNAQKLEEAWVQQDTERQVKASVSSDQWSPRQLPYKTYEKHTSADSDSDESDEEAEDVGLEVGVEEVGFVYKGPEPTAHGDWAHKGRVTDF
ncbi:unnamed protein product [Effrenium voratum]|nr:unnamed protein product [Effrenium voratum]|mmetsp:Transcript_3247/g.7642  ORF Transcript_3247/g.7642 Transcript_3247/m.7642 type:complete len:145 (+) Transcript_3247:39-473(+)